MATGFGFGQNKFGATPAQPNLFGSPAPAPAASGFSFGGLSAASTTPTPAFGFGSTTTPLFGASTPAFGTPTPAFGASTPAFGTSTPAFGASPFGVATTPSAPATSAFGTIGRPGGFPSPASTASSSPASFFGNVSALGNPAAAASSPAGIFGSTTQMAPAAFSSGVSADAAVREINEIRAAYTPSGAAYKFQHLFLNVVENPAQRSKPANVDEIRWRQVLAQAGGPNNPDKLWPVLAVGFKDLLARAAAQQQAIDENQQRLKSLAELSHSLSRQHSVDLKRRAADVQKRHIELSHRLLHVMRLLDALESRLAASLGYRGDLSHNKEQDLSRQLTKVEGGMAAGSSSSLQRTLDAVAASARLRSSGGGGAAAAAQAQGLDPKSLQQVFAVLKEHAEGVRQLQEVLKRDQLDLQIMGQVVS